MSGDPETTRGLGATQTRPRVSRTRDGLGALPPPADSGVVTPDLTMYRSKASSCQVSGTHLFDLLGAVGVDDPLRGERGERDAYHLRAFFTATPPGPVVPVSLGNGGPHRSEPVLGGGSDRSSGVAHPPCRRPPAQARSSG